MIKVRGIKFIAVGLIFTFTLFYSPCLLMSRTVGKGNLIGFVYEKDGTTPVKGAVLKMRNILTGSSYESDRSDEQGLFSVKGIDEGLYIAGISTENGDFNIENLIGVKADETAKISLALKAGRAEGDQAGEKESASRKKGLAGFFLSPAGVAVIVAASVAIIYTIVKLTEEEPEASPFKK